MFPESLKCFSVVVENNHAAAAISSWPPQEIGLMTTEGGRQALAPTEKIDSASLTVILGKDAASTALCWGKPVPGLRSFGHDLLPAELVRIQYERLVQKTLTSQIEIFFLKRGFQIQIYRKPQLLARNGRTCSFDLRDP